jgi:DNA-binding MarR family transcriptional regulator
MSAPSAGDVADAVLSASRVLVAVSARSIAEVGEDVTLGQYRALVVLASRGPQRPVDLAEALALSSSTATRLCDRLLRKRLIFREREPAGEDRRAVRIGLSRNGAALVEEVTRRRRQEIARVVERLAPGERAEVVAAFRKFAAAAGEVPDAEWAERW